MSYQVIVPRPVQKQLDNLPAGVRQRVIERILALKENPRPFGSIKLTNYRAFTGPLDCQSHCQNLARPRLEDRPCRQPG
jgi:hypothetical protein